MVRSNQMATKVDCTAQLVSTDRYVLINTHVGSVLESIVS